MKITLKYEDREIIDVAENVGLQVHYTPEDAIGTITKIGDDYFLVWDDTSPNTIIDNSVNSQEILNNLEMF